MTPELSVQSSASIGVHCHDTNVKGIEIHQLKKKTNEQTIKQRRGRSENSNNEFYFQGKKILYVEEKN